MDDQNQYSDAAYEHHAQSSLRRIARDLGLVLGAFAIFCAGCTPSPTTTSR